MLTTAATVAGPARREKSLGVFVACGGFLVSTKTSYVMISSGLALASTQRMARCAGRQTDVAGVDHDVCTPSSTVAKHHREIVRFK